MNLRHTSNLTTGQYRRLRKLVGFTLPGPKSGYQMLIGDIWISNYSWQKHPDKPYFASTDTDQGIINLNIIRSAHNDISK